MPYPNNIEYNLDHEFDQETLKFSMLYSENKTYAVGHGTSVGWSSNVEIFSDTMPVSEVKQLTPDIKIPPPMKRRSKILSSQKNQIIKSWKNF